MAPTSAPARPRQAARLPRIDPARCTGCGWCVPTCAPQLLSLETVRWKKTSVLHEPERCTGCSRCALKCPFGAISMRVGDAAAPRAAAADPTTQTGPDGERTQSRCG